MENGVKVTVVTDIQLPIESVELEFLKTKDGEKVRVQCERVSELVMMELLMALPGGRPTAIQFSPERSPEEDLDSVRRLNLYAGPVIEAGTSLIDEQGNEIRPAFFFDAARPHHALSIPGRLLRETEKTALVEAVLRLSGYLGGPAAGTFPDGERGGADGGVGTTSAIEVGGENGVGEPA